MTKQRLVVIGNGMASGRFTETLLARKGGDYFDVVVFGEEPYGNYNRILLSSVLAGSHKLQDILLNSPEWYRENGVTLHSGVRVEAVDRARKKVFAVDGLVEDYDLLVFATGSRPFIPPIDGLGSTRGALLEGVFVFRTLDDGLRIIQHARDARKAVVLGGGLLGLEAARGLLNRGIDVHVVELAPHPMATQLDDLAGGMLRTTLEAMGIHFHLGTSIVSAKGERRIESITLSDGSSESCDLLIISAGIRPNVEIAKQSGLAVERGILVGDDLSCLNDPSVHAIGECAQHRGYTYGLVAPGSEQAKILADRLSRANPQASYSGSNTSTTLKVLGVDLFVLGKKEPAGDLDEVLTYTDPHRGIYKKLILREGRLGGAILLGDNSAVPRLMRAFLKKDAVLENPGELLFSTTAVPASAAAPAEARELPVENSTQGPLKEVVAIIRSERWIRTRVKAEALGFFAYTHHRVTGRGKQRGLRFLARRGAASGTGFRFLPKRMVSWIVPETEVDRLVEVVMDANRTGQIGDGKIFVLPMDGTIQIPATERDLQAIQTPENELANA
jgi:nitrite reductase (NADH) large subunit